MSDGSYARFPSLHGKAVFITGGASGIGADLVRGFARQGAQVAFVDIDVAAADQVLDAAAAVGPRPLFLHCDATDVTALRAAITQAAEAFGSATVLINNVADDERHDFLGVTPSQFDSTLAVNLRPHFFAAQAVAPGMMRLGGGSIVNIGSTSWKIKGAGYPVYATCKAAITGLTRSLAREFGHHNIRVNTLTPGWVMTSRQLEKWVDDAGERAMNENQCLPGRIIGDDVARLALFLSADDSRMITAQEFVVDAGWT
jgi:NAD(P)-dependent dehydrogenase (short-subunit alcohol dehydrogenase family)